MASGDSNQDLLKRILINQNGPEEYRNGDSVNDLLRKILINQRTAPPLELGISVDPLIDVVAGGGQSIFTTVNCIQNGFILMEDGVENVLRTKTKTGDTEITTGTPVPQGTVVRIIY